MRDPPTAWQYYKMLFLAVFELHTIIMAISQLPEALRSWKCFFRNPHVPIAPWDILSFIAVPQKYIV